MKNNNSNLKNSEIGKNVEEDKQKNSTGESIKKNEEIKLTVGQQKDNTREKQTDKENIIKTSVVEKPLKYDNSDSKEDSKSAKGEEKTSEQQKQSIDNPLENKLLKEDQSTELNKQKNILNAEKNDDNDISSPLGKIVARQRKFFETNKTLDVNFRLLQLKRLRLQIKAYYDQICSAFRQDLNKLEFDVVLTELGIVMKELNYTISNLIRLAKPKKVRTSLANFPSKGYVLRDPYGVVMIASPWNYPLQLTLVPLIGAIAGGNTAIVKPSRNTPNITKVIKKMLSIFDEDYVYIVTNEEEISDIFDTKFDFIFYTGSPKKAREIAEKQAKYLTPMILELGGKSPCIVDKDANIDLSAKRVVWGKFLNAGQTCVAPDYVLVHSEIKDKFVESAKKWIGKFYYEHHLDAQKEEFLPTFVKIVKKSDVVRLQNLMKEGVVECGGKAHGQVIEPTLLTGIDWDNKIMQEEVFGPIMPVLTFDDLDDVIRKFRSIDKPLALYYFGKDKEAIEKVKTQIAFGGGCINDTIMHFTEEKLPFGGVGQSGMGNYHGARTFYAFTREKSVLDKGLWFDLTLRYPQATKGKIRFAKTYFKI